jgi:cysteine desulfurase
VSSSPIYYFDNNATTGVAPEVVQAMLPFLEQSWGNPSSGYSFGRQAAVALDQAREQLAGLIGAEPREIVFTGCGTESSNAALHSITLTQPKKRHALTTVVEHPATLKYCSVLEKAGYTITRLTVDSDGRLDLKLLEKSLRPDTAIVSVMMANNETGVVFPIREIAAICRRCGVLLHTDAVQVAGKLPIDVRELDVDFLSLSGHKLHAPKGVGLLYVRRRTPFEPYLIGGGQERGRRGGTENVAGLVGFGRAAELALTNLDAINTRVRALRDRLETEILSRIPGTNINGAKEPRLPNTTNLAFDQVEAEGVLMLLDQAGVCASSGSACHAGSVDPSPVLLAMGCSPDRARGSVRFSLGIYNTAAEVDYLLGRLPGIIAKLRGAALPVATPTHAR